MGGRRASGAPRGPEDTRGFQGSEANREFQDSLVILVHVVTLAGRV